MRDGIAYAVDGTITTPNRKFEPPSVDSGILDPAEVLQFSARKYHYRHSEGPGKALQLRWVRLGRVRQHYRRQNDHIEWTLTVLHHDIVGRQAWSDGPCGIDLSRKQL
jgi:hypothetical protein